MSDEVTCTAVLKLGHSGGPDSLYVAVPPDWKLRILPCRLKGEKRRTKDPEWEYRVLRPQGPTSPGELELDPSMLSVDEKREAGAEPFHTANPWRVKYVKAEGAAFKLFKATNPTIKL